MPRMKRNYSKGSQYNYYFWAYLGILTFLLAACLPSATTVARFVPRSVMSTSVVERETPAPTRVVPSATFPPALSAITSVSPQLDADDWPTYLLDDGNSFNRNDTTINASTVARLRRFWTYHAQGSITSQPIVADGLIFWGSWDGFEHATSLSGQQIWKTNLGETTDNDCDPASAGVHSTATVALVTMHDVRKLVVFVGGGDAAFYALDALSGKILWQTALGDPPDDFIWASPVVYNGSVYVGLSSFGDCPSVQGQLLQLNTVDGSVQNTFNIVPDGCTGGSIWGSPVLDTQTGDLYFATGNPSACTASEPLAIALIEVRASDLTYLDSWQVPQAQWQDDSDFGSTPTLFSAVLNGLPHLMVGLINKNGIYYAFDRQDIGNGPVWTASLSDAEGSMAPSAWDGSQLYVAGGNTTIRGQFCQGSVRALDPATGNILWERCFGDERELAAITLVPGLLAIEDGHSLLMLDVHNGKTLFEYKDMSKKSSFCCAATVAHGVLYAGNMDGNLYAFGFGKSH